MIKYSTITKNGLEYGLKSYSKIVFKIFTNLNKIIRYVFKQLRLRYSLYYVFFENTVNIDFQSLSINLYYISRIILSLSRSHKMFSCGVQYRAAKRHKDRMCENNSHLWEHAVSVSCTTRMSHTQLLPWHTLRLKVQRVKFHNINSYIIYVTANS